MANEYLMLAGSLSFLAALLHIGVIIGGPAWYRFFGAGERMATMAEKGMLRPSIITLFIAIILAIWGGLAWSGADLIPQIPYLKFFLILITLVYLIRGILGLIAPFITNHQYVTQNGVKFWMWSSTICIVIGLVHLLGLRQTWSSLS